MNTLTKEIAHMHYKLYSQKLTDRGFNVYPTVHKSKIPVKGLEWRKFVHNKNDIEKYENCGVAVRCDKGLVALDLDIYNERVTQTILHSLQKAFKNISIRVGRSPKALVLFRTVENYTKKKSKCFVEGHVEILANGQYFISHGIHPITGKDYKWIKNPIHDLAIDSIPYIEPEKLDAILKMFEHVACKSNFTPIKKENEEKKYKDSGNLTNEDKAFLRSYNDDGRIGLQLDTIKEILSGLDPACSRDSWRDIGFAVHYETRGNEEGLYLWDEWSKPAHNYVDNCKQQWESMNRDYASDKITGKYLIKLATEEIKDKIYNRGTDKAFIKEVDKTDIHKVTCLDSHKWSIEGRLNPGEKKKIPVICEYVPLNCVTILYAGGGLGKSTLVLYLSVRIAIANEYPDIKLFGLTIEEPGTVVYFNSEDNDFILNMRFNSILDQLSIETGISIEELYKVLVKYLLIPSALNELVDFVKSKGNEVYPTDNYHTFCSELDKLDNIKMVIFDTKSKFSSVEEKNNLVKQEMYYYQKIASKYNATVLLVHHTTKEFRGNEGLDPYGLRSFRGGGALYDESRACWYLRTPFKKELEMYNQKPDSNQLVLLNSKANGEKKHKPILLKRMGNTFNMISTIEAINIEKSIEIDEGKALEAVLLSLQSGEMKRTDVVEECNIMHGVTRKMARKVLDEAVDSGLIMIVETKDKRGIILKLTENTEKELLTLDDTEEFNEGGIELCKI